MNSSLSSTALLATVHIVTSPSIKVSLTGGQSHTLTGVYPPTSSSALLQPRSAIPDIVKNPSKYPIRPCLRGVWIDPKTDVAHRDCLCDVVCAFARVGGAGTLGRPYLLLQWHETVGLERLQPFAPCDVTYVGERYTAIPFSAVGDSFSHQALSYVETRPFNGVLSAAQYVPVKVVSLQQPPVVKSIQRLVACTALSGMHVG